MQYDICTISDSRQPGRHEWASMYIAIRDREGRSPPVVYRYDRSARGWGVVRSSPGVACPRGNSLEGSSMLSFFLLRAHLGNDLGFVHAVVDAVLDSRSRKPGSAQGVLAMVPVRLDIFDDMAKICFPARPPMALSLYIDIHTLYVL